MGLKIRFLLTGKCTANCAYCHNEGQTKDASLLRLSTIESILAQLSAAGRIPEEIVLSGGEPTLHKQVGEIARLCKATGTHVSMDSHAGHPRLLRAALPHLDELKLHIDSFEPEKQIQSMGIPLDAVLTSVKLTRQFPRLQVRVNHPLKDVQETAAFVKQTRALGVDCKVIEMFRSEVSRIPLQTMNWENLGYTRQNASQWRHADGQHQVFIKRCGAIDNPNDTLFIGADGIRRALDGASIGPAEAFSLEMLHPLGESSADKKTSEKSIAPNRGWQQEEPLSMAMSIQ